MSSENILLAKDTNQFMDSSFLNNIVALIESKLLDVVIEDKGHETRFARVEELIQFGQNIKNKTRAMILR